MPNNWRVQTNKLKPTVRDNPEPFTNLLKFNAMYSFSVYTEQIGLDCKPIREERYFPTVADAVAYANECKDSNLYGVVRLSCNYLNISNNNF